MGLLLNDIIHTIYHARFEGQQIRYSLHWRCTTNGSGSTPEVDLAMLSQFMVNDAQLPLFAKMIDCHVADFHFLGCACTRVFPTKTTVMASEVDILGSVVEQGFPPNVSVVITKRTHMPGRRGRGSIHLSGVPIPWINNGELVEATKPAYTALAAELNTAVTVSSVSLGLEPVLYHGPTTVPQHSRIFDARVETTSRTMRRRTVRVGI